MERSQTRAIADALLLMRSWVSAGRFRTVPEALQALESALDSGGLDALGGKNGDYARPRRLEVAAALNRLRQSNPPQPLHGHGAAGQYGSGGSRGGWGAAGGGVGGDEGDYGGEEDEAI